MLYGQRSLSDAAHVWVVGMVAVGTSLTAYWVMCLVAWLQWPIGAELAEGRYHVADWLTVMTGAAPALFGVLLACGLLLAATLMLSVTAIRTRARPSDEGDRRVYGVGLWLVLGALVLQAVLAAALLRQILPVQPARLAATLPQWHSGPPVRLAWLAWPDETAKANDWALQGPVVAADWLPRTAEGQVRGLDELVGMRPPVLATHLLARLAVLLTIVLTVMALWGLWRGHRLRHEPDQLLPSDRWGLRALAWGAIALQAVGWGYLFVGSLPYAVYGTITLRELGTAQTENVLWGGLGLQTLVLAALGMGFRQLLGHTTRYGVVPVARHRGRA
jgi:cytochrome d ubiquinol oxidase subunit I